MNKITLIYDPVNGVFFPDGKLDEVALRLSESGGTIFFANELFLYSIRVLVKKGIIKPENIEIKWTNPEGTLIGLVINEHGKLDNWPVGFCDKSDNYLSELVHWGKE